MRPHSAPPEFGEARRLFSLLASAHGAVAAGDAPAALRAVVAAARALGVPLAAPPGDAGALADLMAACSLRVQQQQQQHGDGDSSAMAVDSATVPAPSPSLLAERGAEHDALAAEGASVSCPACGGVVAAARMDVHVRLWCPQAGDGG